jgi:hypothetical protein
MKLVSHGRFDSRQQALTEAILLAVKAEIEKVDAPEEIVKQLTGSIAFAVTSLLDDVASVEVDGEAVAPMLTFAVGEDELEFAGGNSWMHEYVYKLLPKVFGAAHAADNPTKGESHES